MTVDELSQKLSVTELFEWNEWFKLKAEAEKKAAEKAKAQSRARRR